MFEAYKIGIRLSLINGVASGLISLSRQFKVADMEAKSLQARLTSIRTTMLVGGGMMAAGGGLFYLISKTLPAAKNYANQLALMNTLGMKQADIAAAVGKAWQASYDVPTSSATQNLKTFRELRSAFGAGHDSDAASMISVAAKLQGIMLGLTGHEQDRVGFDLVKATELRTGVMNIPTLMRNANLMARTILAFGGTLSVSDFHSTLKMAKASGRNWDDKFVYEYLPTLMQELKTSGGGGSGGARSAGTYLRTYDRAIQGHVLKSAFPYWIASGLHKKSDLVKNAGGSWQFKPGTIVGKDLFDKDPYLWTKKYLPTAVQTLMKKFHVSEQTVLGALFSDRNAEFVGLNFLTKIRQYERDQKLISQTDNLGAYNKLLKTSPELAGAALSSTWTNLMAVMGFTLMPTLLSAAQALIPTLQSFTKWAKANPNGIATFMKGLLTVAGALAAGGVIATVLATVKTIALGAKMLRYFFAGIAFGVELIGWPITLTVVGLAALGAGIYELWKNWDTVWPKLKSVWKSVSDWLAGIGNWIIHHFGFLLPKGATMSGGGSPYVPKPAGSASSSRGHVYMDGRKVGEIVTGHQAKSAGKAQTGISGWDPSMALSPVGAGGW